MVACCTSGFRFSTEAAIPEKFAATAGIVFACKADTLPLCTSSTMVRAALDKASRSTAVISDWLLQEAALAVGSDSTPTTVKRTSRARCGLVDLSCITATVFLGNRSVGRAGTAPAYMDQEKAIPHPRSPLYYSHSPSTSTACTLAKRNRSRSAIVAAISHLDALFLNLLDTFLSKTLSPNRKRAGFRLSERLTPAAERPVSDIDRRISPPPRRRQPNCDAEGNHAPRRERSVPEL